MPERRESLLSGLHSQKKEDRDMMNKTLIALVVAGIVVSTPVLADSTISGATSIANGTGIGVVSNPNATAGAVAGVVDSPITASVDTGDMSVTNGDTTAGANIGNVSNTTGITQNFQASKIPAPAPGLILPSSQAPQLFGASGATTNGQGIDITLLYQNTCRPKMKRGRIASDSVYEGISGRTNIVFTPHPDYVETSLKFRGLSPGEYAPRVVPEKDRVQEVETMFNISGNFKCLGVLTISADKQEAGLSPFSTILSDAQAFPLEELVGFSRVVLVSSYNTITETRGVDSRGGGIGASGGGSQILGSLTESLGLGASLSKGVAYPESKLGGTFLVLVEDPKGVFIDLTEKKPEPVVVAEVPKPAPVPVVTPEQLSAQQKMLDDMRAEMAKLVAVHQAEDAAKALAEKQKAEAAAVAAKAKAAKAKAVKKPVVSPVPKPANAKVINLDCGQGCTINVDAPKAPPKQ